jgi:hypothetical protein
LLRIVEFAAVAMAVMGVLVTGASAATVTVNLTTDDYPGETTWEILTDPGGVLAGSGGPYTGMANTTISTPVDLVPGDYKFTIYDAFGDGICCGYGTGTWSIDIPGLASIVSPSGGEYGEYETVYFTVPASSAVPLPPALPLFAGGLVTLGWLGRRRWRRQAP